MQSSRQYTFIQNYWHAKSRKYKAKQKLPMGHIRNRLERSHVKNENKINLPRVVAIKLQDKIKITWLMKRQPLLFHLMWNKGLHGLLWLQAHKKLYK